MALNNLRVQECQSRMTRKYHVRFVGEGDEVTQAPLPDSNYVETPPTVICRMLEA